VAAPTDSIRAALILGYDRRLGDFPGDSRFLPSRLEDLPTDTKVVAGR